MVRAITHLVHKFHPIQNDRVHATHPVPIKNAERQLRLTSLLPLLQQNEQSLLDTNLTIPHLV